MTSAKTIDVDNILMSFKEYCFVDVRSPHEFRKGSIPGAANIPLLDDREHACIGTMYAEKGPETAISAGKELAAAKRERMQNEAGRICQGLTMVLYCWRGGMRSQAAQAILEPIYPQALRLTGGYKSWRRAIISGLQNIKIPEKVFVLYGYTGSGKTILIKELAKMTAAIDLEALASHRGSIFGDVGLPSICQKDFDAALYFELKRVEKHATLVLEGESKKIGRIFLPARIAEAILNGIPVNVEASRTWRANYLADEYAAIFSENLPSVARRFELLKPYIGAKRAEELFNKFSTGKYFNVVEGLLEYYYDVLYGKTMARKDFAFSVNTETGIEAAAREVNEFIKEYGG